MVNTVNTALRIQQYFDTCLQSFLINGMRKLVLIRESVYNCFISAASHSKLGLTHNNCKRYIFIIMMMIVSTSQVTCIPQLSASDNNQIFMRLKLTDAQYTISTRLLLLDTRRPAFKSLFSQPSDRESVLTSGV